MNKIKRRKIQLLSIFAAVILLLACTVLMTSCSRWHFPWQKESGAESTDTAEESPVSEGTEKPSESGSAAERPSGSGTGENTGESVPSGDTGGTGAAEESPAEESTAEDSTADQEDPSTERSEEEPTSECYSDNSASENSSEESGSEDGASSASETDTETLPEESSTEDTAVYPLCPPRTWLEGLEIPEFTRAPFVAVHDNIPFFDTDSLTPESYEIYYDLDELGRCTLADAVVGQDTQPTEKRGNISMVKPTGWHTDRYSFINGEMLYNRCHLIAYYLTAENVNTRNLVTGTNFMNRDGMNLFENVVGDYVKETGNHVRYRVTPVFSGDNLLCDGVLMEGYSIEDDGEDICFCVFAYNVQPGVHIDYLTGDNYADGEPVTEAVKEDGTYETESEDTIGTYVLNLKKKKFHRPECPGIINMAEKNRQEYTGSRNALLLDGYVPCPACKP